MLRKIVLCATVCALLACASESDHDGLGPSERRLRTAPTLCVAGGSHEAAFVGRVEALAGPAAWAVQRREPSRFALGQCDAVLLAPSVSPSIAGDLLRFAAYPVILTSTDQVQGAGWLDPLAESDLPGAPAPRTPELVTLSEGTGVSFDPSVGAADTALYSRSSVRVRCVRGLDTRTSVATAENDAACRLGFGVARGDVLATGPAAGDRIVALLDADVSAWTSSADALLAWSLRELRVRDDVSETRVRATDLRLRDNAVLLSSLAAVRGVALTADTIEVESAPFAGSSVPRRIVRGTIVFGPEYGGFLRRVESIEPSPENFPGGPERYVLTTSPASITDLFVGGQLEVLDDFGGSASAVGASPDAGAPASAASLVDVRNLFDGLARQIELRCGAEWGAAISITPEMNAQISGDMRLEFDDGGISRARFAVTGRARALLNIGARARVSGRCSGTFTPRALERSSVFVVPVLGVPIPVLIRHVVQPSITFEVQASVESPGATGQIGAETELSFAATYTPATGWVRESNGGEPRAISQMELERRATATVGASLAASVSYTAALYAIAGPRVRATISGNGELSARGCDYDATASVRLGLALDVARPESRDCRTDPAVLADFEALFGHVTDNKHIAREWYLNSRCSDRRTVLGRFTEFRDVGREQGDLYLNVDPGSDWRPHVNWAFLQGAFDREGEFQLATDPRHPRATRKSPDGVSLACTGEETITAEELRRIARVGYAIDYGAAASGPIPLSGSCGCLAGSESGDDCRFAVMPVARPRRALRHLLPRIAVEIEGRAVVARRTGRLPAATCDCVAPRPTGATCGDAEPASLRRGLTAESDQVAVCPSFGRSTRRAAVGRSIVLPILDQGMNVGDDDWLVNVWVAAQEGSTREAQITFEYPVSCGDESTRYEVHPSQLEPLETPEFLRRREHARPRAFFVANDVGRYTVRYLVRNGSGARRTGEIEVQVGRWRGLWEVRTRGAGHYSAGGFCRETTGSGLFTYREEVSYQTLDLGTGDAPDAVRPGSATISEGGLCTGGVPRNDVVQGTIGDAPSPIRALSRSSLVTAHGTRTVDVSRGALLCSGWDDGSASSEWLTCWNRRDTSDPPPRRCVEEPCSATGW